MSQRLTEAGTPLASCPFCAEPAPRRTPAPDDECTRCASPLYPAARQRFDYSGQRMLERIVREQAVRIAAAWPKTAPPLAATMQDLSLNGMRLATTSRLEPNQIIQIDAGICRATARVAYCREQRGGGFVVGVEFLTLKFASVTGTFVSTNA